MEKETIKSMMKEERKFPPPEEFSKNAHIKSMEEYNKLYKESIENPNEFWKKIADELHWFKPFEKVYQWDKDTLKCRWFEGGEINMSYNCLDRNLKDKADKIALIFQGEAEDNVKTYTYKQLHKEVCKFANVLKNHGIQKGDRICLYLPMIPELAIAMLACTRIGAIHSIVFGGFSPKSMADRINDSQAKLLITADGSLRKGKIIPMKDGVDKEITNCSSIQNVIVVKSTNNKISMQEARDQWWHEQMETADENCDPVPIGSEDPLFILYTSGTTGKPKGVLHTAGGYSVYTYITSKYIFDLKDNDIYWCTADIGWITGHSYIIYGLLQNAATTMMFEGVPNYPEPDRAWQIVEKFKVTIFYTAPTAIRALMREGDEWPKKHDLSTLRLLGSVGEPINPEAWIWYHEIIGNNKCPIVDTWWQTETGGVLITPLPGAMILKPGSANKPFFGVVPAVMKENGEEAAVGEGGYLVIKEPWPSMIRDVWGNPERYKKTYFSKYPGIYFTGDGAKVDEDGDFWVMGRLDDVMNVSGHRIGTAEIESALVAHDTVAESAVVPFPHELKGQAIYAFVTLKEGAEKTDELKEELRKWVGKKIGPIAKPDKIQFADELPKTRSGKIMRRILKSIAEGVEFEGDITTLANPDIVKQLFDTREK
ncbi:acetate--CoA ligase [Candidatus Woesearchaeota archaeon]|nr:acetate--CoA ligase [Candidatus Woesearchaeota archaeon]